MSETKLATKADLQEMYDRILPYMGGMPEMLANKFSKGDLYSTDEKMIGQWIDGKPLYQRSFMNVTMTTSGIDRYFYGVLVSAQDGANIELISYKNLASYDTRYNPPSKTLSTAILTRTTNYSQQEVYCANSVVQLDDKRIVIAEARNDNQNITTWEKFDVTIQYTKTTDSAIAIGSDTDYSTTEKIVGTWIDGKPLYQKTLTGSWTINASNNSIVAPGGASNIDTLVNGGGTGYDFNNGSKSQRVLNSYMGFVFREGNNIGIQSTYKMVWTSVTIQYTKTTD